MNIVLFSQRNTTKIILNKIYFTAQKSKFRGTFLNCPHDKYTIVTVQVGEGRMIIYQIIGGWFEQKKEEGGEEKCDCLKNVKKKLPPAQHFKSVGDFLGEKKDLYPHTISQNTKYRHTKQKESEKKFVRFLFLSFFYYFCLLLLLCQMESWCDQQEQQTHWIASANFKRRTI